MNNYQIAKEAAGIFTRNVQQPQFLSADNHPVRKMITGNGAKREMVTLNHAQVEGIILVTKNQLRVIQIPFKTFDLDADPDMESPLVAGTIGASCANNAPCQISVDELFSNFSLIEKAEVGEYIIPIGKDLPNEVIAALASPGAGIAPE